MANSVHALKVRKPGGPDAMVWERFELGPPGEGEVRIRHHSVGLNFIDVYHREGYYPLPLPLVPGVEAAGEIEAVGPGVRDFKVGDRVAYAGVPGAYSEARIIDAGKLVAVPSGLSFETVAASLLKGLTAQMLLRQVYKVGPDDTILVHAAAGGTGLLLCQWAAAIGATAIGTVSTNQKAELARAHGCHHPIVVPDQDFVSEVARITSGKKLPVVYDSVGQSTFLRSLDCLRPRGLMVTFGQASGPVDPFAPVLLAQKGSLYLTRPTVFTYVAERAALVAAANEVFGLIENGTLRIEINQRYTLEQAPEAHRALESRATTGSTIFTVSP